MAVEHNNFHSTSDTSTVQNSATVLRLPRWLIRVAIGVAALVTALWLARAHGLRWNVSASMPLGFYVMTERPLLPGEIVAVCLPSEIARFGRERGYLVSGECWSGDQPVLKRIAAVEGDVVDIQPDAITINGRRVPNSAVMEYDSRGRALPHVAWGTYTVKRDELWLLSTHTANSWDSRYFGPVNIFDVFATACPVLVTNTSGEVH